MLQRDGGRKGGGWDKGRRKGRTEIRRRKKSKIKRNRWRDGEDVVGMAAYEHEEKEQNDTAEEEE